jgi:rhodanese-related sulfurtransferase
MEFEYVGHPVGAIHVPLKEAPDWNTDPGFCAKVREALHQSHDTNPEDLTILALCRSGARSKTAVELLTAAGFKSVYNVIEGFEGDRNEEKHRSEINGWRFHGLPWEQS